QAVIEFELDGTILTANDNFLAAVGYGLDEIQGRHHSMFVSPELSRSPEYRRFWADLGAGRIQSGEFSRVTKDGRTLWLQADYTPVTGPDGKPYKIAKFATDITATVLQREVNVRFASMTDNSPINTIFADRDLVIRYMNKTSA